MTHAKQPRICEKCQADTERKVETKDGGQFSATFCEHHGGALAIVSSLDGEIIHWEISSCANSEEAMRQAALVVEEIVDEVPIPDAPKPKH